MDNAFFFFISVLFYIMYMMLFLKIYTYLVEVNTNYRKKIYHYNRKLYLLKGTVSGSGTGPLDYGVTGPVPDP